MYIDTRRETEVSIYSCIQRRTGVTLFHESIDRIALIARRVKLPRGRLLSSDLLECVAWLGLPVSRPGESCVHASGVFSSPRAIVGLHYGHMRSYGRIDARKRTYNIVNVLPTDRR